MLNDCIARFEIATRIGTPGIVRVSISAKEFSGRPISAFRLFEHPSAKPDSQDVVRVVA
jgi:hypothetical protein